jgi:F420-non-reducing hydrogenase iron-sulfur subunit
MSYPPSVKIVRVPCTGKVDTLHILRAFEKGADGVYVVGCREGDCHFNSGNFRAAKRVAQARKILDTVGIGGERVRMCNLSSSDGPLFVRYAEEMHETVVKAGMNPIRRARKNKKAQAADAGRTAKAAAR